MINYTKDKLEKIGNTIIYFTQNIPDLSKTKLIKLLYLLEECFIKKYHLPFLDIEFEVWQAGPVNREIFVELSDEPLMLKDYIIKECNEDLTYIKSKQEFSDDEFSDNELEMLDFVLKSFGHKTAAELVQLTHKRSSPWYIIAERNGLLKAFNDGLLNSSDVKIDLSKFYCDGKKTSEKYKEQKMFNRFTQQFSG
jgi:uncharacterized phage-associated protein